MKKKEKQYYHKKYNQNKEKVDGIMMGTIDNRINNNISTSPHNKQPFSTLS